MRLENCSTDRKAQAQALRLRRHEGFKDTLRLLRVQPHPGILHRDNYVSLAVPGSGDREFTSAIRNGAHRFKGIQDQV
jgi:hypothetical protein